MSLRSGPVSPHNSRLRRVLGVGFESNEMSTATRKPKHKSKKSVEEVSKENVDLCIDAFSSMLRHTQRVESFSPYEQSQEEKEEHEREYGMKYEKVIDELANLEEMVDEEKVLVPKMASLAAAKAWVISQLSPQAAQTMQDTRLNYNESDFFKD